jgi:hypothetical protein
MNEYVFFFVGGTGGSFVKLIFYYYLTLENQYHNTIKLIVDPINGNCHNCYIRHEHWINQLDTTKKIVVIDFDNDDKTTISKMAFWKVVTQQIARDPTVLKTNWNGDLAHIDPADTNLLEQCFIKNPNYLIFPDWKDQIKTLTPVLVITFKDIMFGDLNKIIANFFNTSQLPKVDKFIKEYRAVNKKYIDC